MIGCSIPSRSMSACLGHDMGQLLCRSRRPRQECKLSDHLGGRHHPMSLAGLVERQSFVKRRSDLALLHEIEAERQLGHAAHPGPDEPSLVTEEGIEMR